MGQQHLRRVHPVAARGGVEQRVADIVLVICADTVVQQQRQLVGVVVPDIVAGAEKRASAWLLPPMVRELEVSTCSFVFPSAEVETSFISAVRPTRFNAPRSRDFFAISAAVSSA